MQNTDKGYLSRIGKMGRYLEIGGLTLYLKFMELSKIPFPVYDKDERNFMDYYDRVKDRIERRLAEPLVFLLAALAFQNPANMEFTLSNTLSMLLGSMQN